MESVDLVNRQLTAARESLREWACCSMNSPSQQSARSILPQAPCILSGLPLERAGGGAGGTLPSRSPTARPSARPPAVTARSAGSRNPHRPGPPWAGDCQSSIPESDTGKEGCSVRNTTLQSAFHTEISLIHLHWDPKVSGHRLSLSFWATSKNSKH